MEQTVRTRGYVDVICKVMVCFDDFEYFKILLVVAASFELGAPKMASNIPSKGNAIDEVNFFPVLSP